MALLPIAKQMSYLKVGRFVPTAVAERNTMIDLPFARGDEFSAEPASPSLCLMQFLYHDRQPKPSSAWFDLLQDLTALDDGSPKILPGRLLKL
jgi:hypothetical protein